MDMTMSTTVKVTKYKSGPFENAKSMLKWFTGFAYIGNNLHCLIYIFAPFPRGL